MNLTYIDQLPNDFHPTSKVWVYQSSRLLSISESLSVESYLSKFVEEWKSHGDAVKATAFLFFGQFIILMADETITGVGGCSTDSSTRFIHSLETELGVTFFDRTHLAFVINDKIQILPYSQLQYALENGFITPDTLYFNNLVANKKDLETKWIIPVKESWLKERIKIPQ